MRLKQYLIEMAMPRKIDFVKTYYHGTDNDKAAKGILKKGIQPPDLHINSKYKGMLTPVKGKVYITSELKYALIYAIGGDMIGVNLGDWSSILSSGREYAYIFVINGKELRDIQPDEDAIGEKIWFTSTTSPDWGWLHNMAEKELTSKQFSKVLDGEYRYWAAAGKKLVKKMTDTQKWQLIDDGAHIAHTGSLKIKEAWKMHKNDNVKLKKNGSNFFKVAKRIK